MKEGIYMRKTNQRKKTVGNGEGSLFYSPALERWCFQYFHKGKRKSMKQKNGEKPSDFKKRVSELKFMLGKGTYIEKSNETFMQILDRHIEQKYKDNLIGDSSYVRDLDTKKQIQKTCSNFVNKPIQQIFVEDIEDAKDNIREYSNNSINKIWRLLYKTFSIAVSRRKITFNPMNDETLNKPISKKETKKVEALTVQEEEKLIKCLNSNNVNEQYRQIILLQLNTGMRIGEILALSEDCIDLEKNTITVYRTLTRKNNKYILGKHTKTYNRKTNIDKGKRTFPMTPETRKIVLDILEHKTKNVNNLLFWDKKKKCLLTPKRINDFLNVLNESNISNYLRTHTLRHTFITRCQEKSIALVVIQAMVGHIEGSSITSDTYTSVSLDFMREEVKKIS